MGNKQQGSVRLFITSAKCAQLALYMASAYKWATLGRHNHGRHAI